MDFGLVSHNFLVAGAGFLISILVYQYILYPAFLSPLAKIPNAHFLAPYTSFWILRKRLRNQENKTIYEAHKKHGKIIRLGPNEISINSVSDGLKVVYTGNFDKHEWYPNLFANYGSVSPLPISRLQLSRHFGKGSKLIHHPRRQRAPGA